MNLSSGKFIYAASEHFAEKIVKFKKRDPPTFQRIKNMIDRLLDNPQSYDHELHGDKRCKFEKYVGKSLARTVYTWCGKCRTSDCSKVNACDNCETKADNTVIFFNVFYKNEAEKLGY